MVNIYSTIISSTNKCDPSVQVSHKSTIEIEKYLKSRSNILKVFKELCAIQMTQSAEGPNNLSPTSVDDLSHNVAGDDSQLQEFNLTSATSVIPADDREEVDIPSRLSKSHPSQQDSTLTCSITSSRIAPNPSSFSTFVEHPSTSISSADVIDSQYETGRKRPNTETDYSPSKSSRCE